MSVIGRLFIVLNLVLAGCFVGFAGTFLQRHTDWETKHKDLTTSSTAEIAKLKSSIDSRDGEIRTAKRENERLAQSLEAEKTNNGNLTRDNTRLNNQLTAVQKDISVMQSKLTGVADEIKTATADAKDAMQRAMDATAARDTANQAKEAAETSLATANRQIAALEGDVANRNGTIATLQQTIKENDVLLGFVRVKAPGLLALAQPDLGGRVTNVGPNGRMVTVEVSANPASAEIKPGYTFALHRDGDYKGEALITDVQDKFAFCRITKFKDGATFQVGDLANTNLR